MQSHTTTAHWQHAHTFFWISLGISHTWTWMPSLQSGPRRVTCLFTKFMEPWDPALRGCVCACALALLSWEAAPGFTPSMDVPRVEAEPSLDCCSDLRRDPVAESSSSSLWDCEMVRTRRICDPRGSAGYVSAEPTACAAPSSPILLALPDALVSLFRLGLEALRRFLDFRGVHNAARLVLPLPSSPSTRMRTRLLARWPADPSP